LAFAAIDALTLPVTAQTHKATQAIQDTPAGIFSTAILPACLRLNSSASRLGKNQTSRKNAPPQANNSKPALGAAKFPLSAFPLFF